MRGHCNVGDKSSVGDSVTTKVVITVGEGKYNGEQRMTLELEIFNLQSINKVYFKSDKEVWHTMHTLQHTWKIVLQ